MGTLGGPRTDITGFGDVVFSAGSSWTLENGGGFVWIGEISGFAAGDTLDVGDQTDTTATLGANNVLTLSGAGVGATIQLDPNGNYADDTFLLSLDAKGGTDVTVVQTQFAVATASDLQNALGAMYAHRRGFRSELRLRRRSAGPRLPADAE